MPCSEFLDSASLLLIESSAPYFSGSARVAIGDLGERAALDVATNILGWNTVNFSAAKHGFDGVFKDSDGKIVILEAKATAGGIKSPNSFLSKDTHEMKEMSNDWIKARAELMQRPGSSLYTPANEALGREIIQALAPGGRGVRAVLVETSGKEGAAGVYERTKNGWDLIQSVS